MIFIIRTRRAFVVRVYITVQTTIENIFVEPFRECICSELLFLLRNKILNFNLILNKSTNRFLYCLKKKKFQFIYEETCENENT